MVKNALVFLVFLVLALLVTWPLVLNLNHLIIDPVDGLLITWIQNWWLHSRSLAGNIFYPYHATLAFSDYHLVSAILGAPFIFLTHEPLVGFNVNLILGLALTGFSGYLLVKFLTKQEPASFLAGILLAFSTLHLNYMAHPQLFHLWLLILPLLFVYQKRFKLFLLFFLLAVLNSPLNLYFLLFFGVVLRRHFRWFIFGAFLSLPFLLPYYFVSRQFDYTRPITDAINFSLQFPDLSNVSVFSRLSAFTTWQPGTPAYFGIVATVLVLALILSRRHKPKEWLWSAGVSFILALGPALHILRNTVHFGPFPAIPLPYAVFYYLLPGFSGFRTPSRWILLTFLSLVIAVAIFFSKKISWRWAILLSIVVILEINQPFNYKQVPAVADFPPEQKWLASHYLGSPIAQFPIYGWFDADKVAVETTRMYYSTIHWHPMFNGYSGFSPKQWETQVKWLQQNFPSAETIGFLRNLGIKLILVPADWDVSQVQNELELEVSFPNTKIYQIIGMH